MYNVIKKFEKKLMALFAVLLMVSFVATLGVRGPGGERTDAVVGHMGQTPIHDSEMQSAKDQWSWLDRTGVRPLPFVQPVGVFDDILLFTIIPRPSLRSTPLFQQWAGEYYFPQGDSKYDRAMATAQAISADMDKHPELFYLLQAEADRDGIRVSPTGDEVNDYLRNQLHADPEDVPANSTARAGVQGALSVAAEVGRLMDAMKISQPVWQHTAALNQSVRLNLVDFRTSDFQKSVPAPTTQQVERQFDQYKNLPPEDATPANPLGLGYQIPARVKLQYLQIPRAQVMDAVIRHVAPSGEGVSSVQGSSDPLYDRQVQAAIYYQAHLDEFHNAPPQTQPAQSQPATQASAKHSAAPSTQPAVAASQPAIKPFAQVKQEILEKLAAADVDKETAKIADELRSRLASDYELIRRSDPAAIEPTTQSGTGRHGAASTQSSAAAMMFSHLEQIRNDIEQKYFVSVQVHDIVNQWQTARALAALAGVGASSTSQGASFADYATQFANAISAPTAPRLNVWEPSQVLSDGDQNVYVFRLTAAQPPHAPPSVKGVIKQVTDDWKLARAYDMALAAAGKTYAAAQSQGLTQAARTAGQNVFLTELFPLRQAREIPGYPLPQAQSSQKLIAAAMDLLGEATPSNKNPDKLVALPDAERVVVMELGHVQLNAPQWLARQQAVADLRQTRVRKLAAEWFSYDSVVARTEYKAEKKS